MTPITEARAAPAMPQPSGKMNTQSSTMLVTPPVMTASIANLGALSLRMSACKKLLNVKNGTPSTIHLA